MAKRYYKTVICADGFRMSVQASKGHYSEPRIDNAVYASVEVGGISEPEPLLFEHMEFLPKYDEEWNIIEETASEKLHRQVEVSTDAVYGWVPADVILKVIAKHGGQVGGELPPLVQNI